MTNTYRESVTDAADGGLFSYVPITELHARTVAFVAATGLDPNDLVRSRLVNTPIPFYPERWETGSRRWVGLRPEAMWHPLLWMADDIATRYTAAGQVEDDDAWAVRVAYEATNRELYDPETGRWVDLLASIGVDSSSTAGAARVAAWLAGGSDVELDELTWPAAPERLETARPDWAFLAASAVIDALRLSRIAMDAEVLGADLDALCDDLDATAEQSEHADIALAVSGLFAAAEASFAAAGDSELSWWADVARTVDAELGSASWPSGFSSSDVVRSARERMQTLAETYGQRADELAAALSSD